jgi:low affinity Fe/Cu permease
MAKLFTKFSTVIAGLVGSAWAFLLAVLIVAVWAVSGPIFRFSDTWQLVINTGTTIVTFLMVFLIQNTQNRDAKAMHVKLDELIRAVEGARERLMDIEERPEREIEDERKALIDGAPAVPEEVVERKIQEHTYPVARRAVHEHTERLHKEG